MNRRAFLRGLMCTTAVAAVAPAVLAEAAPLVQGELGMYEGIRFVEPGISRNHGWYWFGENGVIHHSSGEVEVVPVQDDTSRLNSTFQHLLGN